MSCGLSQDGLMTSENDESERTIFQMRVEVVGVSQRTRAPFDVTLDERGLARFYRERPSVFSGPIKKKSSGSLEIVASPRVHRDHRCLPRTRLMFPVPVRPS